MAVLSDKVGDSNLTACRMIVVAMIFIFLYGEVMFGICWGALGRCVMIGEIIGNGGMYDKSS